MAIMGRERQTRFPRSFDPQRPLDGNPNTLARNPLASKLAKGACAVIFCAEELAHGVPKEDALAQARIIQAAQDPQAIERSIRTALVLRESRNR